jgi:hypothetical protein
MSDGGRGRAWLGVKMWKSSQKWSVRRSAVRSIAWLDARVESLNGWTHLQVDAFAFGESEDILHNRFFWVCKFIRPIVPIDILVLWNCC